MKMKKYVCPMHHEEQSNKPAKCSICGMDLVKREELGTQTHATMHHEDKKGWFTTYKPLIVVIFLIILSVAAVGIRDAYRSDIDPRSIMSNFMAGFFLVFAGFKLLDLRGFADGYSTYDLLAKKFYPYGYIYPFIELAFGIGYLIQFNEVWFHLLVFAVMTFSGFGVYESLRKKRVIQCACLGTIFKLPLAKVTLVEDFGMALMAITMIVA